MSTKTKVLKKPKQIELMPSTNTKVRDYSQLKVDGDIKKCESSITKLEESIKNHEQEFKDKAEQLKELKKKLEEYKFIKSNLPLCQV